jgi:two-component sensor histidine kinase
MGRDFHAEQNGRTSMNDPLPTDLLNDTHREIDEPAGRWKIIIADDDQEVHAITRLALEDFEFEGKTLKFFSAYSASETIDLVRRHPDAALILLDVVMEEDDSGLQVVRHIRTVLGNHFVRIILRTGQPGRAPRRRIIDEYDINDYKEKIELTDQKLYTAIVVALRAFRDLRLLEESRATIAESLHQKEILLKELHHRVKNNLQVISSLLNMQASMISDPVALEMFEDSRDRVTSMALLHERLYRSGDFSDIDFGDYIHTLAGELSAIHLDSPRISVDVQVADVRLDIEKAVPFGLIVNELVTNCMRHAFPDGREGTIRIHLYPSDDGVICLEIADNGIGLPAEIGLDTDETLGLRLVGVLVEQIGGSCEIVRVNGTRFTIRMDGLE